MECLVKLPAEIIEIILDNADYSVLETLRGVSKVLNKAASRRLYRRLTVDDGHAGLLARLISHTSNLSSAFSELKIISFPQRRRSFIPGFLSSRRNAQQDLLIVLRGLEHVSTVSICARAFLSMPADLRATTIQAIGALPALCHLKLDLRDLENSNHIIDAFAQTFRNLCSLEITGGAKYHAALAPIVLQSPQLASLTVNAGHHKSHDVQNILQSISRATSIRTLDLDSVTATSLSSPLVLQRFPSLCSLTLGSEVPDSVWNTLRTSNISLREVTTRTQPSYALLSYLQSFDGLSVLSINGERGAGLNNSDGDKADCDYVQVFWACVVLRHAPTLERLDATGCRLGRDDVGVLKACSQLRRLDICVDGQDPSGGITNAFFDMVDEGFMPKLRSVNVGLYSHPQAGAAGMVKAHHELQEIVGGYRCTAPGECLKTLRVNTGHMVDNVLVKEVRSNQWKFKLDQVATY
ncbi:hypothetical protein CYLTODRAFT_440464 [Cylindrobasidium torrendii FP15055 ss-10]|uniref:F-box domain-containing protein n=1 Tax=Cylindrobasidium torrendii FP15055 ss-10 TaxID=1314674 RepID=A0A0D7BQ21_9AGAR|nr:hypothetical protein CYLTODRAFT_440464 [Cylindrobasidium torrendii FP15055 ss-10]